MSKNQRIDPYLEILGIPPEEQPPNYYRLLGLQRFERDPEVIRRSATLRAKLVTAHKKGAKVKFCDELLYLINTAKTCLMDPRLKAAYDRKLVSQRDRAVRSVRPSAAGSPLPVSQEDPLDASEPLSDSGQADVEATIDLFADDFDSERSSSQGQPAPEADLPPRPARKEPAQGPTPASLGNASAADQPTAKGGPAETPDASASNGRSRPVGPQPVPPSGELQDRNGDLARTTQQDNDRRHGSLKSNVARREVGRSSSVPQSTVMDTAKQPARTDAQAVPQANAEPAEPTASATNSAAFGREQETSVQPEGATKRPSSRPRRSSVPWIPEDAGYEVVGATHLLPEEEETAPQETPPADRAPSGGLWRKVKTFLFTCTTLILIAFASLVVWVGYVSPDSSRGLWELLAPSDASTRLPNAPLPRARPLPPRFAPPPVAPIDDGVTKIGIACGTEKRTWLERAVEQFALTEAGKDIRVQLMPMESLASADAIVRGETKIDVWAPASSLYEPIFRRDWRAKHHEDFGDKDPILREESLALTPMVILMWKSRYEALTEKVPQVTIERLGQAMHSPSGWETIADRPEWGRFKFGHTKPSRSNSGLMSLLIIANGFAGKESNELTVADIMSPEFQNYLLAFERGVEGTPDSTDRMINDMILRGPTKYDAVMVYESVAIDFFDKAAGRWEPMAVIYPQYNYWNDNPYYILDTPWTSASRQAAAEAFLDFLMSEPIQRQALEHGFRPGNTAVPIKFPESPFVRYESQGLRVEIESVCPPPSAEALENLQQTWLRNIGL